MTVLGPTHTSRTNALIHADARADTVSKSTPESSFRKVYETTERKLAPEARTTVTTTTDATLPALSSADADALALFVEANRRTESGGVASFSSLLTTAGPEHRASFGVAQLTSREHLARLSALDDTTLASLGTNRRELDTMSARGDAAIAFYHLLVDGRAPETSRLLLGLSTGDVARIRELVVAHDERGLDAMLGARFTESTGLPSSALHELVTTRALLRSDLRAAFRAQYEHDHGVAFAASDRETSLMANTARHVALAHPELDPVVRALGNDDAGALALGHYLGVGDTAENMLGWHARAASTIPGAERWASLLAAADPITSRAREEADFARAVAAAAGVRDLEGEARITTLARLARLFHGAPARARESLFVDGRFDAPRFTTRADLDAAITTLRASRSWSDDRLLENLSAVLAERRTA